MLELPEAHVIATQLNKSLVGKRVIKTVVNHAPHKLAFYHGDPEHYPGLLEKEVIGDAQSHGGLIEITAGQARMVFGDGVALRYLGDQEKRPLRHQLLLELEDGTALVASVQMYGGIWCFQEGEFDNFYYRVAKEKPSPLGDAFNYAYFESLFIAETEKLSAKAFLATEQRIPGLGNGVLQDILYNAQIHPRQKIKDLSLRSKEELFRSVRTTLKDMVDQGGRDTEKDLFGCLGKYKTKASKKTVGQPCLDCSTLLKKENYMGGSIYYCPSCQKS